MSSANRKNLPPEFIIPIIDSDLFSDNEIDRFALYKMSPDQIMSYKQGSIEHAYLKLRANAYIDLTNMIDSNKRRPDGTESDNDDKRSIHFAMLERRGVGKAAVFACMRLIVKVSDSDGLLPIEKTFPEAFIDASLANSAEVSRLISCHDDPNIKKIGSLAVMGAGVACALENKLGPIYGIVEPLLERYLKRMGLPIDRIADPKSLSEYNDNLNLGIEIDKFGSKQCLGEDFVESMMISSGSLVFLNNDKKAAK